MRRAIALLVLVGLFIAPEAGAALLEDGHGIHVESVDRIDARQLAVRVSTDALQHPVDLRILLPNDYFDSSERFPVLYLFHGTSGRASDWVNYGDAVETTAGLPLIVVMPDAGFDGDGGGWFTNWYNAGAGGPPMWESFHVRQVIPWIDDNLRTQSWRAGRAIAGLSQGGFGALSYAARHPGRFTSVAAFSGGCVIDRDPQAIAVSTSIIQYTTTVLDGVADQDAIFGPRATNELNWQAHDPGTLVGNFRGMQIELFTGDGTPGPFDTGPVDSGASSIEMITFVATQLFDGYLNDVGIPHGYHYYGGGTHTFPYWARDLRQYIPTLMRRFANPPDRPRVIDFTAAEDRFHAWGWTVTLDRPAPAFATLAHARPYGFALTGTGEAHVATPAYYEPGQKKRVTQWIHGKRTSRAIFVSPDGRIRLTVPLGDGSTPQTRRVAIRPL